MTIQNWGRLTSHSQSLTNVFSQSPTHSPSRKMWFRHNRLSAGKFISQQSSFFHSFFQQTYLSSQEGGGGGRRNLLSRQLCKTSFIFFWPVLRKRAKACRIASVCECWKKTCPTLALPYHFCSGPKGEREGKRKVVNLKPYFFQGSCGVTQTSEFKSSGAVVT